jgi:MoaA/NifB/PqqE/SkfB family radical SAM enzyme
MKSDFWRRLLFLDPPRASAPIAPGIYHTMREMDGSYSRFHLRVDADGSGMLLANATAGARLNASGVLITKLLFDEADDAAILREVAANFRNVSEVQVQGDLERLKGLMQYLANPGDTYPVVIFEDTDFSPYTARLIAPLQATLPLTETDQMTRLLDRLWEVGVPHATILAPCFTLEQKPDATTLVHAVEHAEDLGMIAGVRWLGSEQDTIEVLRDLALAGVDYITLPYASTRATVHDELFGMGHHAATEEQIATIHEYEVCPVAEVPLLESTVDDLGATFEHLAALDVGSVSLFAPVTSDEPANVEENEVLSAAALLQVATLIEETSYQRQVRAVWQPLVRRNPAISLAEQVERGPRCHGDVAVRIEPDGSVIPARGSYHSAGNILSDDWEHIWRNPAFRHFRESVAKPEHLGDMPDLTNLVADDTR